MIRTAALSALLVSVLAACGDDSGGVASSNTISGSVTVSDAADTAHLHCAPDQFAGAELQVADQDGSIVGVAQLGEEGVPTDETVPEGDILTITDCRFDFTIPDVAAADFYSFSIGGRSGVTYTADELDASGWTVELVG